MSHFVGIFFGPTDNIEEVLDKYYEGREVPSYIDKTKDEVKKMVDDEIAAYFKYVEDNANNTNSYIQRRVEDIQDKLKVYDYFNTEEAKARLAETMFDLDANGNSLSTYNPDSKWDWWVIGGRWSCEMLKTKEGEETNQDIKGNLSVIETPLCFIDLNGEWIERGEMGWFGTISNEMDINKWEDVFKSYLDSVPDDTLLTVIDFHI